MTVTVLEQRDRKNDMVEPTTDAPDNDLVIEPISSAEKELRASRLKDITFGQYKAIRSEAIKLGVPLEVASMLPWYAADPQAVVSALRAAAHRQEIIARNVLGVIIECDVLTAHILRSLENLRAEHERYQGKFTIDRLTTTDDGTALRADLAGQPSIQSAFGAVETQLQVVDDHISRKSPYGEDIRVNGIRRGGVLFPVVLDLPGSTRIGGLESTDSYSRTLFAQHHSGITVSTVLQTWLEYPPTTPKEFSNHPAKKARNKLVAIARAIVADPESVTKDETSVVLRAVMPKTSVVLAVDASNGLRLDEVRRRLVSERHLDKQLEFSEDAQNETRAEAVIGEFDRRAMLPERPGFTQQDTLGLLENPRVAIGRGVYRDDLMVVAAAVFLPTPNTKQDRLIFPAIRSRGVITPDEQKKKWLRSELATQVIMRSIPEEFPERGLRKSALERALRQGKLRGATLDARPVPELLTAALAELEESDRARRRGEPPTWGSAMVQITLRGAFYLFFGHKLALDRSPVGGKKGIGDNREATQIIEDLGNIEVGLQQLAQAIYDGRNNIAVRLLPKGTKAEDIRTEPSEENELTDQRLRKWLGEAIEEDKAQRLGEDNSARSRVHTAAVEVKGLTNRLDNLVKGMAVMADKVHNGDRELEEDGENSTDAGPPYVRVHGLCDTFNLAGTLDEIARTLAKWHMRFELRGNSEGKA
ncbi:hypothetical protein M8C13_04965 [Crossiella sp. SN42]|uniref:hypothetical protein n=1 Tax=Crossiella sp. SN42 TaxID=2944808 RepID=UPI00207C4E3B|nr:hypothetical protein [Crossiella sp. SN42]MCO1575108.1 hypothetical protein [Crossiella sp. SN42]